MTTASTILAATLAKSSTCHPPSTVKFNARTTMTAKHSLMIWPIKIAGSKKELRLKLKQVIPFLAQRNATKVRIEKVDKRPT